jgi:tetratricopeptide (TPR) repeat protein
MWLTAYMINILAIIAVSQWDLARACSLFEESVAIYREMGDRGRDGLPVRLTNLATGCFFHCDFERAHSAAEEGMMLGRELGIMTAVSPGLWVEGWLAWRRGEFAKARSLLQEGLELSLEQGDKMTITRQYWAMGVEAFGERDYARAGSMAEESLTLSRETGYKLGIAMSLVLVGFVACVDGEYPKARSCFKQSFEEFRELENRWGGGNLLEGIAWIASAKGSVKQGVRLWGAAEALWEEVDAPLLPFFASAHDRQVEAARSQLSEEEFENAWQEGRAMSTEEAIRYALAESEDEHD